MGRGQRSNWRRALIVLGLAAMEAVWLAALFLVLVGPAATGGSVYTTFVVAALLLLPILLSRALTTSGASPRMRWTIMTLSLVLALIVVWSLGLLATGSGRGRLELGLQQVMVLLLVLAIWWRGNTLAQLDVTAPNLAIVHFWLGLSVFFLVIILGEALLGQLSAGPAGTVAPGAVNSSVGPTDVLMGLIPAYFFFSLATLSLARIEEVIQLPESTASPPPPRQWLAIIVGSAGFIVAGGLLAARFFVSRGLASSLGWLPPLLRGLGEVLQVMIIILVVIPAFLLSLLAPPLQWLVGLLPFGRFQAAVQDLAEQLLDIGTQLQALEEARAPGNLWITAGRVALALALVLAILLASRAVRQRRQAEKTLALDKRVPTSGLLKMEKDGSLIQRGLGLLQDRLRDGLGFMHALTVRRIYANLCRLAASRGHPRQSQLTPDEYQVLLGEAWPQHKADILTITRAYVQAHYGQVPDSSNELARVRRAWQRIQASE
jgi:hypothetical protein